MNAAREDRALQNGEAMVAAMVLRRRELAARLAALSRSQSARIAAGDHHGAVSVLTEREPLVDDIAALSAELRRRSAALTAVLDAATGDEGRRLSETLDETQALLDEVSERDGADALALSAARAALGESLSGNARAQAAMGAYGGRIGARVQDREV